MMKTYFVSISKQFKFSMKALNFKKKFSQRCWMAIPCLIMRSPPWSSTLPSTIVPTGCSISNVSLKTRVQASWPYINMTSKIKKKRLLSSRKTIYKRRYSKKNTENWSITTASHNFLGNKPFLGRMISIIIITSSIWCLARYTYLWYHISLILK